MHRGVEMVVLSALLFALFTPLVSSSVINNENTEGLWEGKEIVLFNENTWTSIEWVELEKNGIQPLRQLSFDSLLVWVPNNLDPPSLYAWEESPDAQWKKGINFSAIDYADRAVVVLEPNLPVSSLYRINDWLVVGRLGDEAGKKFANSPVSSSINIQWPGANAFENKVILEKIRKIPGVLWIEEDITANSRNSKAASIIQHNQLTQHPLWDIGLNGQGIILSIADTGIDRDHSCFRNVPDEINMSGGQNSTGVPGINHRKILLINETIDDWDTIGEADGRHGTHTAGSLGCFSVNDQYLNKSIENFRDYTSISYASKLIIQDLVNSNGWIEPPMDGLLWEMARNGGVIHSDSWGDATTAYTLRSSNLDGWVKENPWSIIFVAPGNNGGQLMEPANARSVVAVGATNNDNGTGMYSISSHGPTEENTRGIFIVAPGVNIISAAADSDHQSNNNGSRTSSGTSMATPTAAATAGIIQQMVEEGWISPSSSRYTEYQISNNTQDEYHNVLLSEGFTPSNNLIRALLALSADPLLGGEYRGVSFSEEADQMKGWGRPDLQKILNTSDLIGNSNSAIIPANDIWIHDSYQLNNNNWTEQLTIRINDSNGSNPLDRLAKKPWNGSGAVGPFLSTGQNKSWIVERSSTNDDFEIRLAWNAKSSPSPVDDLQLIVKLPNGSFAIGDRYQGSESQLYNNDAFIDSYQQNNETVVGIKLSAQTLGSSGWLEIEVRARNVTIGGSPNSLGIDGDKVGFSLAAKGIMVDRPDDDGDGIPNMTDACPITLVNHSVDEDGCADYQKDSDEDGVTDDMDGCEGFPDDVDRDEDGIIDGCDDDYDTDGDGIYNNIDLCNNTPLDDPINEVGCYPNNPLWVEWEFNTPLVNDNDNMLLIRHMVVDNDLPNNESMVWVNITSKGSTIFLCNDDCDVDIILLWTIFDYDTGKFDRNYSVSLEWVEYDVDGYQVSNGSYEPTNITIKYNWVEPPPQNINFEGGEFNGVWFSILIISIALVVAIAQIWRGVKKEQKNRREEVQPPFYESE